MCHFKRHLTKWSQVTFERSTINQNHNISTRQTSGQTERERERDNRAPMRIHCIMASNQILSTLVFGRLLPFKRRFHFLYHYFNILWKTEYNFIKRHCLFFTFFPLWLFFLLKRSVFSLIDFSMSFRLNTRNTFPFRFFFLISTFHIDITKAHSH